MKASYKIFLRPDIVNVHKRQFTSDVDYLYENIILASSKISIFVCFLSIDSYL